MVDIKTAYPFTMDMHIYSLDDDLRPVVVLAKNNVNSYISIYGDKQYYSFHMPHNQEFYLNDFAPQKQISSAEATSIYMDNVLKFLAKEYTEFYCGYDYEIGEPDEEKISQTLNSFCIPEYRRDRIDDLEEWIKDIQEGLSEKEIDAHTLEMLCKGEQLIKDLNHFDSFMKWAERDNIELLANRIVTFYCDLDQYGVNDAMEIGDTYADLAEKTVEELCNEDTLKNILEGLREEVAELSLEDTTDDAGWNSLDARGKNLIRDLEQLDVLDRPEQTHDIDDELER